MSALPKQGSLQLLMMDSGIYSHWKDVGYTHSLTLDSDIAAFLLQHYEKFQSADLLEECLKCHGALSQYCAVCCLIYNFTPATTSCGSCDLDLSPASNQSGLQGGLAGGNTIVIRISDGTFGESAKPETGLPSLTVLGGKPCLSQNSPPPSLQSSEQLHVPSSSPSALLRSAAKFLPDDKQLPAHSAAPRTSNAGTSKVELPCSVWQNESPGSRALSVAASGDKPASPSAGFEHCERLDKVPKTSCVQNVGSLESGLSLPLTACQDSDCGLLDVGNANASSSAGLSRLVKARLDLNNGHNPVGKSVEKTNKQITTFSATLLTMNAAITGAYDGEQRNNIISIPSMESSSLKRRNETNFVTVDSDNNVNSAVKTTTSDSDKKHRNKIIPILTVETSSPKTKNETNFATVDNGNNVNSAVKMDTYSYSGNSGLVSFAGVDSSSSAVTLSNAKEEREGLNRKSEDEPLTPSDVSSLGAMLPRSQRARKLTPKMESLLMDRKRNLYPKPSAQETVLNMNYLPERAVRIVDEDHRVKGQMGTEGEEEAEAHSLDLASDLTVSKSESTRATGSPLTIMARNTEDCFPRQRKGRNKLERLPPSSPPLPPWWQKNSPAGGSEAASAIVEGTKSADCSLPAEMMPPESRKDRNTKNNSGGKQIAPLTVNENVSEQTLTPATMVGMTENIGISVTGLHPEATMEQDKAKIEDKGVAEDGADSLNLSETAAEASRKIGQKFPCKVCGKVMGSKTTLVAHLRIHDNDRPFRCPHCTCSYTTAAHLKAHLFKHMEVKPHKCPECSEAFARSCDLKLHLLKHAKSRPFICDICEFGAKTQLRLKKHRRVHEATKAFQCPVCGQKFRWRPSLRDHLKLHTDERPFCCLHCDKKYVQSGSLKRHMERRHTPDRKREWVCHLCGEARYDRWQFDKHMAIHTGSKQHKCQICSAAFIQSSALRGHMKIHRETDGKEHRCPICKAAFKAASSIRKHLKKAHRQEQEEKEEEDGINAGELLDSFSAAEVLVSVPQGVGFFMPSRECLPTNVEMVEMVFRQDGTCLATLPQNIGARLPHCRQVVTLPQEVSVTLVDNVSMTLPQTITVSELENFAVSMEDEVKVEFPDTAVVLEEMLR